MNVEAYQVQESFRWSGFAAAGFVISAVVASFILYRFFSHSEPRRNPLPLRKVQSHPSSFGLPISVAADDSKNRSNTVPELEVYPTINRRTAWMYQANNLPFVVYSNAVAPGSFDAKTNTFICEFGDRDPRKKITEVFLTP